MDIKNQNNVVASAISQVTIFLKGAEIQREGVVNLQAGAQQLIFENLPQDINPRSIQVSGTGNFTILGVSHRLNYLKPAEKTKEIINLETSLKALEEKIELQQALYNNLNAEEIMLGANQSIGGQQTGVKISELKEFADFFRTRLDDLIKRKLEINTEIQKLTKEIGAINNQLHAFRSVPQKPTSVIIVEVTAAANTEAKLTVNYLVFNAGWSPSYDLRVSDINNPVELTYKANVYQHTGEEWKNVKPVFSTANPTINNAKPVLNPWFLSFYQAPAVSNYQSFNSSNRMMKKEVKMMHDEVDCCEIMEDAKIVASTSAQSTTVHESQTSVEFVIDIPYTVDGNGQSQAVELAKYSLPAIYEYYAVRKLEKDVFLLAKITGWEKLNLLSGVTNVFFEGKYVGESNIETRQTDDTLALSLGRDKNITITRIRKKDFSEKQFLGSTITETREWDLTVHNKKKQTITIIVEDQIPVSTEKEIKVETLNISGAEMDKETGKLSWKCLLEPTESKNMNVKYTVKYPKNRTVVLE